MQRVLREVTRHPGANHQSARLVVDVGHQRRVGTGGQVVGRSGPFDRRDGQPLAAIDQDVVLCQRKARQQQPHEQRALAQVLYRLKVVAHLKVLNAVGATGKLDDLESPRIAAEVLHLPPPAAPGSAKLACCVLPSASTAYCTMTCNAASMFSTVTAFTAIRCERCCCKAL